MIKTTSVASQPVDSKDKAKRSFGYPRKYEYIKLKSDGPGPLVEQHCDGEEVHGDIGSGAWTVNEI